MQPNEICMDQIFELISTSAQQQSIYFEQKVFISLCFHKFCWAHFGLRDWEVFVMVKSVKAVCSIIHTLTHLSSFANRSFPLSYILLGCISEI